MQSRRRCADGERVYACATEYVGGAVAIHAVDVENVLAISEADVDRLDGARDGFDTVEHSAAGVVDRRRERGVRDVVAGAEQFVVHGDLWVGPHAHAGYANGGQLAGFTRGVAVDIERVVTAFAEERDDAAD